MVATLSIVLYGLEDTPDPIAMKLSIQRMLKQLLKCDVEVFVDREEHAA